MNLDYISDVQTCTLVLSTGLVCITRSRRRRATIERALVVDTQLHLFKQYLWTVLTLKRIICPVVLIFCRADRRLIYFNLLLSESLYVTESFCIISAITFIFNYTLAGGTSFLTATLFSRPSLSWWTPTCIFSTNLVIIIISNNKALYPSTLNSLAA